MAFLAAVKIFVQDNTKSTAGKVWMTYTDNKKSGQTKINATQCSQLGKSETCYILIY